MELKELWLKQKLKGVFVQTVDSPAMPLIAQQAGMDFIFYDCEHGSFTYDKLTNLILLGNGRGFPSIVRVAQLARADVSGILDCRSQRSYGTYDGDKRAGRTVCGLE